MDEFYFFSPLNPHRLPDWRWQMANYLKEQKLKLTRSRGDCHVRLAKQFSIELDAAVDEWQRLMVLERYPALHQAWFVYKSTGGLKNARWELEARLLAAEPHEDIARKTGLLPQAVEMYSLIFFDVGQRLENTSYITQVVIGNSAKRGISEREPDVLWKMFGYWGGAAMLDFLVYRSSQPVKPDSPAGIAAFLADDIRGILQLKTAIAIHGMQVNWQTQTEIVNLYLRMIELEKQVGGSEGGAESLQAGIQGLMESLPWTRSAAEAKRRGLVSDLERGNAGLRADELLLVAAGQTPAGLAETLASAVYPPRIRKTTVSN